MLKVFTKACHFSLLLLATVLTLYLYAAPAFSQSAIVPGGSAIAPGGTSPGGSNTPPPVVPQGSSGTLPTAQSMLVNISEAVPNLMRLVTAIAYVLGMILIFRGIIRLKHVGEMRTQMSHEHNVAIPIVMITCGTLLLYLPSAVQIGLSTFWNEPNPYGYVNQTDEWSQFINICFVIIQLIGTIAFIRGLLILSHLGGHGGQPGSFSRGLTHVIGGILCINIYQFVQVIQVTLGINT